MTTLTTPRHIKVRGTTLEYCEDYDCFVGTDGLTSCGRLGCPSCGSGGTNLSIMQAVHLVPEMPVSCECGFSWIPVPA
jgi:hypothetical protein